MQTAMQIEKRDKLRLVRKKREREKKGRRGWIIKVKGERSMKTGDGTVGNRLAEKQGREDRHGGEAD